MTGADTLATYLAERGIARAFGIPGNQLNPLLFAMKRRGIELVVARHEGGASLMAEAFARISREVGVCLTIPGPGVANAYVGLVEAFNDSTPLLLLTVHQDSTVETADYSALFHGLDHARALAPVTRGRERVLRAADLLPALDRAFAVLRAERSGPVLLEVSAGVFSAEIPARAALPGVRASAPAIGPDAARKIARAAVAIRRSEYPMILAGEGVHFAGASADLLRLARAIGAPVATTTLGKGAISEYDPQSVGSLTDMLYSDEDVVGLLERADLVLAVGVKFTQIDTEGWTLRLRAPLVHLDSDADVVGRPYPCEHPIVAPVRLALGALADAVGDRGGSRFGEFVERARARQEQRLHTELLDALRDVMAPGSVLSADINIDADLALARFRVHDTTSFLFPGVSLVLGCAVPAAIGAKLARPGSKVVALCGDGGFLMSSPELATAIKYGLDVAFVVVNDGAYGTVKYRQLREWGDTVAADLSNPDFVALARAYGAYGERVERKEDLRPALARVVRLKGPAVLEIDKPRVLS